MDQSLRNPEFDLVLETLPSGLGFISIYSKTWIEIDEHSEVMEVEKIFETDLFPIPLPFPMVPTLATLQSVLMIPEFSFPPVFLVFPNVPMHSVFPVFLTTATVPMVPQGDWVHPSEASEDGSYPLEYSVCYSFLEDSSLERSSPFEDSGSDGGVRLDYEDDRGLWYDPNDDSFTTFSE